MAVSDTKTCLDFQNILVATDFSDFSEAPLSFASAISRRYKSQLLLLHVISPDNWQFASPDSMSAAFHDRRRTVVQKMAKLLRGDRFRGISTGAVLREGELCDVLSTVVKRNEVDVVVIGTHGHLGSSKIMLGSKAEALCGPLDCPILIIGPNASKGWEEGGMRNILLATDLTRDASQAVPYVLSLAEQYSALVHFLHVDPGRRRDHVADSDAEDFSIREQLKSVLPRLVSLWKEPNVSIALGSELHRILGKADTTNANLIVLSESRPSHPANRERSGLPYQVACRASCPVLSVCESRSETTCWR